MIVCKDCFWIYPLSFSLLNPFLAYLLLFGFNFIFKNFRVPFCLFARLYPLTYLPRPTMLCSMHSFLLDILIASPGFLPPRPPMNNHNDRHITFAFKIRNYAPTTYFTEQFKIFLVHIIILPSFGFRIFGPVTLRRQRGRCRYISLYLLVHPNSLIPGWIFSEPKSMHCTAQRCHLL
jgi:hypothetical protein